MTDFQLPAGAIDLHVHAAPDVVERADDLSGLLTTANAAGMAAVVLKDHNTSTVGRCAALNLIHRGSTRFLSGVVLNPAVGGLNPLAAEAALRAGASIVWMPTFWAEHHMRTIGRKAGPGLLPPEPDAGYRLDADDPALYAVLHLIAKHDAILATGHLSPSEIFALLPLAARHGVRRMLVTHANEIVPGLDAVQQQACIACGAWIEYSFLGCCVPGRPRRETIGELASAIRRIGSERLIISSDFGQPANGPAVQAFRDHLAMLESMGITRADLERMVAANPRSLLDGANGLLLDVSGS